MKKQLLRILILVGAILVGNPMGAMAAPQIHGKVFQDLNCDGIRQDHEPLIPGVALDLLMIEHRAEGPVEIMIGWTSTDHNGRYSYTDLQPGKEYVVHFIAPLGVSMSPRNQGNDDSRDSDVFPQRQRTHIIHPGEHDIFEDVDAGLCIPGEAHGFGNLSGRVFEDLNANGIRDDHEPFLHGIEVELYVQNSNGGTSVAHETTNGHGEYVFPTIPAGQSVFVKFNLPVGYNFTRKDQGHDESRDSDAFPLYGRTESIVLSASEVISSLDAGMVHTPAVEIHPDGDFSDWDPVNPIAWDAREIAHPEDEVDWELLWVTHHGTTLSLSYSSYNPVSFSSAYNIFLDTNFSGSSGFEIGDLHAEYLLQGDAIYKYSGTGRSWVWTRIGTVDTAFSGHRAELIFSLLPLGNPYHIKMLLYGDNAIFREGGEPDFFPDSRQGLIYSLRDNNNNKAPVGYHDTHWTTTNIPILIPFKGHDPEGFEVFFSIASQPHNGTLEWEGDRVVYHPHEGFTGTDSFTYTVNDGHLESDPYPIDIHVLEGPADHCPSNHRDNIYVDGLLGDWTGIAPVAYDPADIHLDPWEADWRQLWLAHDAQYFYFGSVNDTVPFDNACTWAHTFFLDTDDDAHTGFVGPESDYPLGAELMLQGAFLFRYTGHGTDWSWECIDAAAHATVGNTTEFRIDRWHIGFDTGIIRIFAVGFNQAFIHGGTEDYMPDGKHTSLCYRFDGAATEPPVLVNAVENQAFSATVYRDYVLTVLARKPLATNSPDENQDPLQVELTIPVVDGQTWALQRSVDLMNWETYRTQIIREKSIITLDPAADDQNPSTFYRAILVEQTGEQ
jgi:hypothetical protein